MENATSSGTQEVYFDSNTADSIHDVTYIIWFLGIFILFYIGFIIGTFIYKR